MEPSDYCREIEAYLCRKNEGHLIRIVGPAFEQVCGWAAKGVPLKIAFRGIDQYCERYYAKGPKRRPVRIEFCEADILDLFDAWRRAVGVGGASSESGEPLEPPARKPALSSHIERVVARLTGSRAGGARSERFHAAISEAVRELDDLAATARSARGEGRARIIERLAAIDARIVEISASEIDGTASRTLRQEAEAELAPFGSRMAPEARARATEVAYVRLVRESLGLPVIVFE